MTLKLASFPLVSLSDGANITSSKSGNSVFWKVGLEAFIVGTRGDPAEPRLRRGWVCLERAHLSEFQNEVSGPEGWAEWWGVGGWRRGPGQGPPGVTQSCHVALLVFCPLHLACPWWLSARLSVAPAPCSLDGGWEQRGGGAGGGTKVKTLGSELGSPFSFSLWVPAVPATLQGGGAGDCRRGMSLWKYPNGVSLSSISSPLSELQSPSQAPCLPRSAP